MVLRKLLTQCHLDLVKLTKRSVHHSVFYETRRILTGGEMKSVVLIAALISGVATYEFGIELTLFGLNKFFLKKKNKTN